MQNKSLIKNLGKGVSGRMGSFFKNPYRKMNINWFKLKYLKHMPPGPLRKHKLFGKWFFYYNPAELLHGLKEIFMEKIYEQELPPNAYIIDCGANIGMSVIYMKQLFPDATILAFEPDDKNFELLSKNVESFGLQNVTLKKEAVWKENTTLNFSNDATMSSRIEEAGSSATKEVKAIRLKDIIDKKVDFLKIDIEGAEFEVVTDLADKLGLVNNLFIEYHGVFSNIHELTKLFEIVTNHGFAYYIKEAAVVFPTPFTKHKDPRMPFDLQLNIFCFRNNP